MLVGEGGQGIQTIAKIIAISSDKAGYHASVIPNFGTEQRGGISIAFLQVSPAPIIAPKFMIADLFIITSERNIERTLRYIGPHTNVIYDKDLVSSPTAKRINTKTTCMTPVSAFRTASQKMTERSFNVILIGILTGLIDPNLKQAVLSTMDKKFDKYYKKNDKLKKYNHDAFSEGYNLTQEQS